MYRNFICQYKSQEGCLKEPVYKCIDRYSNKEIYCCYNCAYWLCEDCPGPVHYCEQLDIGSKTPIWTTSFGGYQGWC